MANGEVFPGMRGSDHLIPVEAVVGTTTPSLDDERACPNCGSVEDVEPTWMVEQFHCTNCLTRFQS